MLALMIKKLIMVEVLVILTNTVSSSLSPNTDDHFVYNGFKDAAAADLYFCAGVADITANGLLKLKSLSGGSFNRIGHAFHSHRLGSKVTNKTLSFSTSFIFSAVGEYPRSSGCQGIAFVLAPQPGLPGAKDMKYTGLFDSLNNGQTTNHYLVVEIHTISTKQVGIRINNFTYNCSNISSMYGNFSLIRGDPIQVWIQYDGVGKKRLSVVLAPVGVPKPRNPLFSYNQDLSAIMLDYMYVGLSASPSSLLTSQHYILGWSFMINGEVQPFNLSQLPNLPPRETDDRKAELLRIMFPITIPVLMLTLVIGILLVVTKIRNNKLAVVVENWELNYGGIRFSYKDLQTATNGFREKQLLGIGGFGSVYKGVLPTTKAEVAVKRISHNSKQGVREFISEIISIGNLRHRNLAHLLGYCRHGRELLLVYDYMPNGSLDKLIFSKPNSTTASTSLDWNQRFQIIKGVACALIYLHEEWEQVVIHRDIKASNVLLDREMNARLGDFGLARLYDHGTSPKTTNVAGTFGYIAPEMIRTGKATTSSDVFAFGALLLEVACGRRPTELHKSESEEGEILVQWVLNCWRRGAILQTSDPNLKDEYAKEEMELVLKLGLLCSHNDPKVRPSMRKVMQYLEGEMPLPEIELSGALDHEEPSMTMSSPGKRQYCIENAVSVANSILSGPR